MQREDSGQKTQRPNPNSVGYHLVKLGILFFFLAVLIWFLNGGVPT